MSTAPRLTGAMWPVIWLLASGCGSSGTAPATAPTPTSQPCSAYPSQATSPYVLPYAVGAAYYVAETTGHPASCKYAVDFLMPIGSTITAARAGIVVEVREDNLDSDRAVTQANMVLIAHDDETLALYGHLTHQGALVDVGAAVTRGQPIALSGNSGFSTQPHLHFEVVKCTVPAPSLGACPSGVAVSVPMLFHNTGPTPCGLQVGQTPRADSF